MGTSPGGPDHRTARASRGSAFADPRGPPGALTASGRCAQTAGSSARSGWSSVGQGEEAHRVSSRVLDVLAHRFGSPLGVTALEVLDDLEVVARGDLPAGVVEAHRDTAGQQPSIHISRGALLARLMMVWKWSFAASCCSGSLSCVISSTERRRSAICLRS